jgi:cobalt-zinc-cadmium efflux system outer membrane protein
VAAVTARGSHHGFIFDLTMPFINMQSPARFIHHCLFSSLALLALGCQSYHAVPLNHSAIEHSLAQPTDHELTVQANQIRNPLLHPVELQPSEGLSPDEAAIMAVVVNPSLRAERDRRNIAQAELLQAGILPNPQLSYNYDWVTGGDTLGTVNAYGLGLNWEITSLITRDPKVKAASAAATAVDLDVAWREWVVAETARMAAYDLYALQSQLAVAQDIDHRLQDNFDLIEKAANAHLRTSIDLAAADDAARAAHATVLQTQRDLEHQRLQLNRAIGVAADIQIHLRKQIVLPFRFDPPAADALINDLELARLDLLGLKKGYESQEQTLRAAVLGQFPKVSLGFNKASDTTNVHTTGVGVNIDIPLFDRNQGAIASEKGTRQKLFDEYIGRVFDARADIASALADIHSINDQIADSQAAIPALQRLLDAYKQSIDRGNIDVLSYYQAWNNLAQKQLEVSRLQQQLADNRIALELATGRYFQDDSSAPPATQPITRVIGAQP